MSLPDTIEKELEDKIEQLKAELDKHRWIPVGERLPEACNKDTEWSEKVQVYHMKNRHLDHDWYLAEQKRWHMNPAAPYTHWRPTILPELLQENQQKKLDG